MTTPEWLTRPFETTGEEFRYLPDAPRPESRTLIRGHLADHIEPFTRLGQIVDEVWPRWQRALRESLGFEAGAPAGDGAAANKLGRAAISELEIPGEEWGSVRAAVSAALTAWVSEDEDVLNLLAAAGHVAPGVRAYDRAVRAYDKLEPLMDGQGNVLALAFRIADDEAFESGRVTDAVRNYLDVNAFATKSERKTVWRKFLALGADTAMQMDADLARLLPFTPLPADAEVGRLSHGIFLAARDFLRYASDDELAQQIAASFILAGTERTNHGRLVNELHAFRELSSGHIPEEAVGREFGGLLRAVMKQNVSRRDAIEAELQRQAAAETTQRWSIGVEPYSDGRIDLIEIGNSVALAEEGKQMRHCVGGYTSQCMNGTSVIWSLRINGNRVATAELRRVNGDGDEWYVNQLAGYQNGRYTTEIREAAERLAERCRGLTPTIAAIDE